MAIKLEMLKCFAMVAKHGSLADASEALGRTPSAVSMMLKQFEDHIGAPLFETTRKSRLTPLGDLIYEEARREVTHFENSVSVIEGLARSELGYLRLAVTPSVATAILPPIIYQFTQKYPKIQIDLRDMDSTTIARELQRERADIGIGTFGEIDGMQRIDLFSDTFGVVCHIDHPLAKKRDKLTWRDMEDHALIANGLCSLITDPDFAPILANSRMMVPNTSSLLSLVRTNVGITILPQLSLAGQHEDITFLPLKDVSARRPVQIVSQPTSTLMPAATAFIELTQKMKRDGGLKVFQNSDFLY